MSKADDRPQDMQTFHFLLSHRREITRKVQDLVNGVETVTESENAEVAARIQEHVWAMRRRLKQNSPIHMRDPLFREIFRHSDQLQMKVENTSRGVRVQETSTNAHVVRLIQAHARVVSAFLVNGHEEVHRNHSIPSRPTSK